MTVPTPGQIAVPAAVPAQPPVLPPPISAACPPWPSPGPFPTAISTPPETRAAPVPTKGTPRTRFVRTSPRRAVAFDQATGFGRDGSLGAFPDGAASTGWPSAGTPLPRRWSRRPLWLRGCPVHPGWAGPSGRAASCPFRSPWGAGPGGTIAVGVTMSLPSRATCLACCILELAVDLVRERFERGLDLPDESFAGVCVFALVGGCLSGCLSAFPLPESFGRGALPVHGVADMGHSSPYLCSSDFKLRLEG